MRRDEVGRTRDAGWEIGVSRTVDHPVDAVWEVLTSPAGTALWVGRGVRLGDRPGAPYESEDGVRGEVRGYHPRERLRLTWQPEDWDHETTVQVVLAPAAGDRTSVRFHQERLSGAEERDRQREHWRSVLDAVEAALAQA